MRQQQPTATAALGDANFVDPCYCLVKLIATEATMSQSRHRFTVGGIKKVLLLWDEKYANDCNGLIAALKREYGMEPP